jgi:hypothetical protein
MEQLVTRRAEGPFHRVTAVSTTGFSAGATSLAEKYDIELREVKELSAESFADWLHLEFVECHTQKIDLVNALLGVDLAADDPRRAAAIAAFASTDGKSKILRVQATGELASAEEAFTHVVQAHDELWAPVQANGPAVPVHIQADYPPGLRFELLTAAGPVEIAQIRFAGQLALEVTLRGRSYSAEYRRALSGEVISQVVAFEAHSMFGMRLATEFHRFADSGETEIILRRLPDDA